MSKELHVFSEGLAQATNETTPRLAYISFGRQSTGMIHFVLGFKAEVAQVGFCSLILFFYCAR
jgi:hypothetical protein